MIRSAAGWEQFGFLAAVEIFLIWGLIRTLVTGRYLLFGVVALASKIGQPNRYWLLVRITGGLAIVWTALILYSLYPQPL